MTNGYLFKRTGTGYQKDGYWIHSKCVKDLRQSRVTVVVNNYCADHSGWCRACGLPVATGERLSKFHVKREFRCTPCPQWTDPRRVPHNLPSWANPQPTFSSSDSSSVSSRAAHRQGIDAATNTKFVNVADATVQTPSGRWWNKIDYEVKNYNGIQIHPAIAIPLHDLWHDCEEKKEECREKKEEHRKNAVPKLASTRTRSRSCQF